MFILDIVMFCKKNWWLLLVKKGNQSCVSINDYGFVDFGYVNNRSELDLIVNGFLRIVDFGYVKNRI